MAFEKKKTEYSTISITVKARDKEKLLDLVGESCECFSSPAAFFRSAINFKLEDMGIDFRLL